MRNSRLLKLSALGLCSVAFIAISSASSPTLEDKIEGMLIGSAIGDAAGGPVEFVDPPLQSEWVKSNSRLTPKALDEIGSRFSLSSYPKKAEPFAQWEDYAPAGTITDDTRFKIIFFNALKKHGRNLNQQQFAQSVLDFREFVKEEYRDNYDEWIPEIAYATNWALGKREDAFPVERIWGGIPTMEGQMPFLPIAAINPSDPEWCYKKCYELGYFDIGVAKDINSALIAGLAAALQNNGSWKTVEKAMREVDPYRYNETLYVNRELTKWLDLAHDLAKKADGNPSKLFELLEKDLDTVYWWEAWVPIVVVFAIAETADYHPLACMQLTMEFGHDTDSYAQVMGALLGAIHGKSVFPKQIREVVNYRMKEQFNQNINDWMRILRLDDEMDASIFSGAERPNIILMMADDMGYGDLSSFGSPAVNTPNIDRLGIEGMTFSRFYAASAVCSPTRASALTGRYPLRFNITKHFNDVNNWLPEKATTVAELLKKAGYSTAHIGKWHLGGLHVDESGKRLTNQPGPPQHGFDFYQTQIEQQPVRGKMGKDRTLFRQGGEVLMRNDQKINESDPYFRKHLTDANGDFAVEMIEKLAGKEDPFFINLWWLVPHKPYEPAPEPHWSATQKEGISDDQHRFRSMVQHMDAKVGQILDKLDALGIADNTLILFTSDNGAAYEGYIGDLKGGKTDLHEGGIRVPMLVRWPQEIPAGRSTTAFGHSTDLLPTFCEAAGINLPDTLPLDGLSLLPHMKGGQKPSESTRGTVFWQINLYRNLQRHYPKPEPFATEVAKRGKWKLLALEGKPVELFDVHSDPNEQRNVIDRHPELVEQLTQELRGWLADERIGQSMTQTKK